MILINDFKAESEELRASMLEAARRVFESGWYILGEEVSSFERRWARECGSSQAIGVGNGMDAIEISLRALGIGPGDEVVTTSMTAFATVLAVVRAGATPVLADISPDTALMSPRSVERCLSSRTKAILLVHLYGQVAQMPQWKNLAAEHEVHLIEDCAQAHLAKSGGKIAGSFGIAGAFSFYPTKNLGAIGDGGMIVTSSDQIAEKARRLRNYGQSVRYHHPELGMNSRLDELQAAILGVRLNWLGAFTERRIAIAETYHQEIKNDGIKLLTPPSARGAHVYHLFVIHARSRLKLQEHLHQKGVQSLIHYPVPIHRQEPFISIAKDPAGLMASESHAETCLSIPCHPQMSDAQVEQVVDTINSFKRS